MKRWTTTLLATMALLVAGLVASTPAQAGETPNTMVKRVKASAADRITTASCELRQRWTWHSGDNHEFKPGDCHATPKSTLVMEHNGRLALYFAGFACFTPTYGYFGASAIFQGDGNFVIYWNGTAVWDSGTAGNPNSRLILRGGDGSLLIRNEAGGSIWYFC